MLCLVMLNSTPLIEDCFAQFIKVDILMHAQLETHLISNIDYSNQQKSDNTIKTTPTAKDFYWVEIRSRENISIVVEVIFADLANPLFEAFYLNAGYFDKSKAISFLHKPQGFPINLSNSGYSHLKKQKFRCWIGISGEQPVELNIAYN